MKRLWIIADDLTGAIDTGIKFADCGIQTCVLPFGEQGLSKSLLNASVIVFNTMSRHDTPETSKEKIKRIMVWARKAGIDYIYKKQMPL